MMISVQPIFDKKGNVKCYLHHFYSLPWLVNMCVRKCLHLHMVKNLIWCLQSVTKDSDFKVNIQGIILYESGVSCRRKCSSEYS